MAPLLYNKEKEKEKERKEKEGKDRILTLLFVLF